MFVTRLLLISRTPKGLVETKNAYFSLSIHIKQLLLVSGTLTPEGWTDVKVEIAMLIMKYVFLTIMTFFFFLGACAWVFFNDGENRKHLPNISKRK